MTEETRAHLEKFVKVTFILAHQQEIYEGMAKLTDEAPGIEDEEEGWWGVYYEARGRDYITY